MEERLKSEATRELTTEDMLELIDPDTMGYHGKEGISDGTCDQ